LKPPTLSQFRKLVGIGNYQFGKRVGTILCDRNVRITCSKRTKRIRHVFKDGKMIATLRPKDGCFALTPYGAKILLSKLKDPPNLVIVQTDVADFIKTGGDVFAKHVLRAAESLRPAEEAIVIDEGDQLLAVGRAVLSGNDMRYFKRGVAVKVRKGVQESSKRAQGALAY